MLEAFLWGALASGALLLGAILAYVFHPGPKLNACVMAAGAGLLLGSVAYDLIEEALGLSSLLWVSGALFLGAAVFVAGDLVLDRRGAANRKSPTGEQASGSAEAIVMGSVLDGIPESFVLGLTVLQGAVNLPLLIGVAVSNFPGGMSSSSGLRAAGWPLPRMARMWLLVVLVRGRARVHRRPRGARLRRLARAGGLVKTGPEAASRSPLQNWSNRASIRRSSTGDGSRNLASSR